MTSKLYIGFLRDVKYACHCALDKPTGDCGKLDTVGM
jgi:hypothetical protein